MPSIASPRSWTPRAIPAWALAAVVAAVYLVLAPPSADLAAQYYRADLGLALWDNGWYAGHHMPGYSCCSRRSPRCSARGSSGR